MKDGAGRGVCCRVFFLQAEDGIRDLVRSRGLGDVYKRQALLAVVLALEAQDLDAAHGLLDRLVLVALEEAHLLSLIHI